MSSADSEGHTKRMKTTGSAMPHGVEILRLKVVHCAAACPRTSLPSCQGKRSCAEQVLQGSAISGCGVKDLVWHVQQECFDQGWHW